MFETEIFGPCLVRKLKLEMGGGERGHGSHGSPSSYALDNCREKIEKTFVRQNR